ncbi:hypothetical protein NKH77_43500 [Streptomyces sp. M19]
MVPRARRGRCCSSRTGPPWSPRPSCGGRRPRRGHPRADLPRHPLAVAEVECDLSLANMDWEDFADSTDDDGVFRPRLA